MYEEPVQPQRRTFVTKKRVFAAAGLLILVAAVAGVIWLYVRYQEESAPLRTTETFLNHMFNKRVDEAYDLTSDIFREETTKEEFSAVAEQARKGLKKETLKPLPGQGAIQDTDRGQLASILYEIDGTDGKYEMTVRVLKEENKGWLIVGVENIKK